MELFLDSPPPQVCVLDEAKAARFKARTMLLPSMGQVREAILAIPNGTTKTLTELRQELAAGAGADITCPFLARKHWLTIAAQQADAPWWRVLKDGRLYEKLPGGTDRQRELLLREGIEL